VVLYTPAEVRALTPVRENVEKQDHAWDDRQGAAKELHDQLVSRGVKVWFSEKDVGLGVPLLRAIDKGLANSRIGIVLVTLALLQRLPKESIADKELSALLAGERLVPVVHNTTYEALREVSPLLASRSGLSTAEEPMADVAAKLAELVAPLGLLPPELARFDKRGVGILRTIWRKRGRFHGWVQQTHNAPGHSALCSPERLCL